MDCIFVICCFFVLYPYAFYPCIVRAAASVVHRTWVMGPVTPAFSVIISAYNEEDIIRQKVQNTLECEYPPDLLEIIVVSDGSSDRTVDIVAQMNDPRVVLKAFHERSGKTACLNKAAPQAKGEILLFTDANSMFPKDLLLKVARNFHDGEVGMVTGWTRYQSASGTEEATGVYARLERTIKQWESRVSSCVGADGALFAMRKSLYTPMGADDINDFVLPLQVVAQGKRVVLDPEVFCMERSAGNDRKEFHRQARITNRTLTSMAANISLLNPLRFGSFSFLLISHKLLRFLVPFFAVGVLFSTFALAFQSWFYRFLFLGEATLLAAIVSDGFRFLNNRILRMAKTLLITLAAQSVGWWRFIRGRTDTMWIPQR